MEYEFRDASGRLCCKGKNLCPACQAKAGLTPVHATKAQAPEHDPLAGYRPTLDKEPPHARQQPPPQSSAPASFNPPDPYTLALDKETSR